METDKLFTFTYWNTRCWPPNDSGQSALLNFSNLPMTQFYEAEKFYRAGSSIRQEARRAGVPRQTLHDRLSRKHGDKHGRAPLFTEEEEARIAAYCEKMRQIGRPRSDKQIIEDANILTLGWLKSRFRYFVNKFLNFLSYPITCNKPGSYVNKLFRQYYNKLLLVLF